MATPAVAPLRVGGAGERGPGPGLAGDSQVDRVRIPGDHVAATVFDTDHRLGGKCNTTGGTARLGGEDESGGRPGADGEWVGRGGGEPGGSGGERVGPDSPVILQPEKVATPAAAAFGLVVQARVPPPTGWVPRAKVIKVSRPGDHVAAAVFDADDRLGVPRCPVGAAARLSGEGHLGGWADREGQRSRVGILSARPKVVRSV